MVPAMSRYGVQTDHADQRLEMNDALGPMAVYGGLFAVSFVAATILPAQSEMALGGALVGTNYALWSLVVVATAGNTAGALLNYYLGKGISGLLAPARVGAKLQRPQQWFAKFGVWSLFFSWLPIIGDALTIVAGIAQTRLRLFLPIVAAGKGTRYAVLASLICSAADVCR